MGKSPPIKKVKFGYGMLYLKLIQFWGLLACSLSDKVCSTKCTVKVHNKAPSTNQAVAKTRASTELVEVAFTWTPYETFGAWKNYHTRAGVPWEDDATQHLQMMSEPTEDPETEPGTIHNHSTGHLHPAILRANNAFVTGIRDQSDDAILQTIEDHTDIIEVLDLLKKQSDAVQCSKITGVPLAVMN